jgi:DNA-directed RNA polymerase beta' subunit
MELRAPDIIVRNEKRMLQEAVDACSTTAAAAAPSRAPTSVR